MSKELITKKPKLNRGKIYLKDGVWIVKYVTVEIVKGGSSKQLGSYKRQPKIKHTPISPESAKDLKHPYDQGKETCFELILSGEDFETYAKLWPTSEMAQDLQHYFETTPQEKIDEDWEKVKELDLTGPTVDEFLGIEKQLQMIPKSEMKQGWYNGYCRNNHMAYWDEKEKIFYYLRYSFGFYMDKIEHFEDVKEERQDGFIPIERVERINWVDVNRIKEEVGY